MKYQIWSEGYQATGESSGAYKHGELEANNFKEACDNFFNDDKYYNSDKLTYWGCRLFDNEVDARKSFG
jgi:hypothetical protein